ncbi:hypothetical protein SRABI27_00527 [Pedobacter sp. Bi27]|uniref:DUF4450 domain-containing protein n=1 Tax=Pedobacter sp. Bi27 TaxID=2822351 RepID=UPI001D8E1BC4|nr:DUF4450 domain-containing protein [Pedobacter sp. Bi27]CAH0151179.1 hypothetical protein SRABI27_00527 [Pedobacter sp. Bi27]
MKRFYSLCYCLGLSVTTLFGQELYPPTLKSGTWHNEDASLRYRPEGRDFVIHNGTRRFTRALYGTNTAFRVEAGDLPEFALYMPAMGGNLQFGLLDGKNSKWLIKATDITARYRPGSMIYTIKDPLLGDGTLHLTLLALSNSDGTVLKARFENVKKGIELLWVFGGASDKKFSRSGDMGVDPESSFYLEKQNCKDNLFTVTKNSFELQYAKIKKISGIFPAEIRIADAADLSSPLNLDQSKTQQNPVVTGKMRVENGKDFYVLIQNPEKDNAPKTWDSATQFKESEKKRKVLADRVQVDTPDPFFNTIGGALAMASDGIWEAPSYMHGAIGWRMRLPGWRGPYTADPLAWHDRARTHFDAYAKSQVLNPESGPVLADTAFNLSRSKEAMGTAMFSNGYISREPDGKSIRPHHYDMNLVYIDQLLWHFNWTGDLTYVKEMWPVIKRHLAWEKRVFDADDNGLYDAYAAIWASDALQYSGGSGTHSSAYNYRANLIAAKLARLINEDPGIYQKEANKILKAMNTQLWMPEKGWYAEYKDALGLQQLHPAAGLWTVYHSIDSEVPDAFQAWQSLRYVDTNIPHIPVRAKGLEDKGYYTLSTTNWMPYEWSLNNVVLAEVTHTALANWQAGRTEEAFKLWKSELLASMYIGGSAGNFAQVSRYDAILGESYRDFGDPVGINSRTLVEGLFGIVPDALNKTLLIRPGLPQEWDHAALNIPDLSFSFKRKASVDTYELLPRFAIRLGLKMRIKARSNQLKSVKINGKAVKWKSVADAIGLPEIEIESAVAKDYLVELIWGSETLNQPKIGAAYTTGSKMEVDFGKAKIVKIFDPQQVLNNVNTSESTLSANLQGEPGDRTFFVQVTNGQFTYWFPVCFKLMEVVKKPDQILDLTAKEWTSKKLETQDLSTYFNDQVGQIFNHKYLSPRPQTTTLQLAWQGIGDWTHPKLKPEINDMGLRKLAGNKGEFSLASGVVFKTPSDSTSKNIIYTAQWDNFPRKVEIPLSGKASGVFFLLAGTTNPMQSRMDNGEITVQYTDGSTQKLPLRNPENWWPIEQDLFTDGFAFDTGAERPVRVHLKTGKIVTAQDGDSWNGKDINGGAATALGLKLDPNKTLAKLTLSALCNDVIIGLMAVTLVR